MAQPPRLRRFWPLFALAAVLWFWPVSWSLWTDEFFSAGFAHRSLQAVIDGVSKDRHPPLFFFAVRLMGALGDGDNTLRALSGLAMLGALAFTVDAARRHLPERAAWAVGAWFAASAVPALFAHTLRMYGMVAFAGAVMTWGALEAATDDDVRARRGRWALAVGGIAAFWTHYAATLVGLAAFVTAFAALLPPGRSLATRGRVLPLVGACAAVVAGCLPWLLGPFRAQFSDRDPVGAMVWEVWAYLFWSPNERLGAMSFIAFFLGLAGALWLWRRGSRPVAIFAGVFLAAMVVLPFVMSANVPARLVRNYVGFFPAAALFSGAALDALWSFVSRRVPPLQAPWIGAPLACALTLPATVALLKEPFHPQDINIGHDYRLEAQVLDRLIPADASVRFQPTYVVEQFARYVPALRQRTGKTKADWALLTSGGDADGCLVLHAFRVRVQVPTASCAAAVAALSAEADATGYPGLLLERAVRAIEAGQLDAASADLARVLARPQRWPVAWLFAAQLAEARKDDPAALEAYTRALALARAYETPGKVVATLWRKVAKLREAGGDAAGAAAATEASTCAAEREPIWACGGPLAWATRPAEVFEAEAEAAAEKVAKAEKRGKAAKAAPVVEEAPLPEPPTVEVEADDDEDEVSVVPTETPAAKAVDTPAPPARRPAPPVAKPTPVAKAPAARTGAPRVQFSFAAGLPAGWLTEGVVTPESGGLRIGDGHGAAGTVCSAPLPASGPVIGTVTRGVTVNAETPPTWSRIEARALGADKKALAGTKPENLGSKKETSAPAASTIRWTPPAGATSWRLCVRTSGAANGSTLLLGVELE